MTFIKINGTPLPNPSNNGYSVTTSDIDSEKSTRSETGLLNRDRIRASTYKIGYKCICTTEQLETINAALAPDKFTVEFYFCGNKSAQMYAGDRSINFVILKENTEYWEFSCNFIEY